MERHLKVLHESPLLIPRILHTVVGTGLLGFFLKLYKPSESNALFDGASLVLYMVALIIYLANTIPGLREVTSGSYDMEIVGGEGAIGNKDIKPGEEKPLGKADSLRVLAASNTIQALVLLGVLVLQAGQWYADRKQREEMEESAKERETRAGKSEGGKHRSPVGKKKV
ncbi:uncharacterized protein KY384_009167 [Bacidia gigantensis]|uniref:uncharacterized protein n=1 Tax=Bacidia gigantensis TaxID=2732470 RepID=UPI001D041751|nr:uncharacterized protein KY384_009167 [Bacidia gigantensis]KAG8525523.1 hypothetical protein KY384_009167 [Bacidia gigantensis]